MKTYLKNPFFAVGSAYLFIVLLGLAMEWYWVFAIPILFGVIYLLFYKLDKFYYLLFILTPVSINLEEIDDWNIGFYFPTEPLIFGLMLFVIIKYLYSKNLTREHIIHPLSIIILLHLGWILFTSLTSTMFVVSIKFFLVRAWYIICFYFLAIEIYKLNPTKNIKTSFWCYFLPLLGVVIYTLIRHTSMKYDEKAAHWVMQPFFKDHTSYGSILAMITPFVYMFTFKKHKGFNTYFFVGLTFAIFNIGLVMSYTRAAWVSLIIALGFYLLIYLKINWKKVAGLALIGIAVLYFNWEQIILSLEKNKQDSSDDLVEHVQSISNIASDASNLERINRWSCAVRMFQEKPILGWGPGTYMFQYAPFQKSDQLTIISTNFGDGGNAHSEYLGPLAESGFIGALLMLSIVGGMVYYSIKVYHQTTDPQLKKWIVVVFLGFFSYAIHGFLNNYLDTDKASVLFWSFIAFIVANDINFRKIEQ